MKKQLPNAVIYSIVAVAVLIVGVLIWKFAGQSSEIDQPVKKSPGYIEGIPDYVKQGRNPNANEIPNGAGAPPAGQMPPNEAPRN